MREAQTLVFVGKTNVNCDWEVLFNREIVKNVQGRSMESTLIGRRKRMKKGKRR